MKSILSVKAALNSALVLLLLLATASALPAQTAPKRYLVYFRDKANSPYSVGQPQQFLSARALARRSRQGIAVRPRDLPVNPAYVAQVRAVSGSPVVLYTSRWLNAAVVQCDAATLTRVQALPSVQSSTTLSLRLPADPRPGPTAVPTTVARTTASTRADYGHTWAQDQFIGAVAAHDAGFRGEGMQIAVFDAGFPGADQVTPLQRLQQENRILSTRNFVDGGRSVYLRNSHGTNCLGLIGGEQPGVYVGTAPRASFHLCLTEDVNSEYPIEEANWLAAAEYADSVGVDVISSSLGYNTFDDASLNHTYADLNGRTTVASRAALGAARAGMVVVNSAGNDGNNPWHYIAAPADADSIISVGATDSLGFKAGFSSFGPTADGRLKPTLAAMGVASAVVGSTGSISRGNGTSYACPELAGLVADFWQANPTLTAQQVIAALVRSGSQFATPDNALGYGVPNFTRAMTALGITTPLTGPDTGLHVFPNPNQNSELTLALPALLRGQELRIRLVDARGAVVAQQKVTASAATANVLLQVPRRGLAAGTYLCEVQPATGSKQSVRFVQQ